MGRAAPAKTPADIFCRPAPWGLSGLSPTILAGAAVLLAGCADGSNVMSVEAGGYAIEVTTSPSPPQVGRSAAVSVRIRDPDNRTARACNVSFRQHMPEHEMSTDDVVVPLEQRRSGVYTGRGPQFSMGGDWQIEVSFDCGTGPQVATVDFSLEWPE